MLLETQLKELDLTAYRIKRKIDGYYDIMIFNKYGFYYTSIRVDKAKNVEKALRQYTDIYKIPVHIAYYGVERKREKPRHIGNINRILKK